MLKTLLNDLYLSDDYMEEKYIDLEQMGVEQRNKIMNVHGRILELIHDLNTMGVV